MTHRMAVLVASLLPFYAHAAVGAQTNAPPLPQTAIQVETIAQGLANPWAVQVLPDGRYLVTERAGKLKLISQDGATVSEVSGVPPVDFGRQGGLLDAGLAPDFATTGTIFLSYAEPRGDAGNGTSVAKAILKFDGDGGRLEDLRVIFQQQPAVQSASHFGSRLVFVPDGTLFVTTGERFSLRDQAQNPANQLGKIIHITPEGDAAPGNPKITGWDSKVWSIGHRNVQGAALHPVSRELWTVEHGAQGGDELNHPQAGKNYGWPVITYGRDYTGEKIGEGTAKAGLEQPVYYWDPSIAVSSLMFYTGELFPNWKGSLIVGSLKGAHLQRLVLSGNEVAGQERLLEDAGERLRDVRQAPDGSILVLTDSTQGRLLRLTPIF